MSELDREIFDDLILCFFGLRLSDHRGSNFLEIIRRSFPENEVHDFCPTKAIARSCGCCSDYIDQPSNYIKE